MDNYPQAEKLYKQSLEIKKLAVGEKHPDYANALQGLAEVYDNMGDYVGAEPLLRQSLEIRKQALGEKHPDYANNLNSLAIVYKKNGRLRKG